MADGDTPAVTATLGPTGPASVPTVSRSAVVGPARATCRRPFCGSANSHTTREVSRGSLGGSAAESRRRPTPRPLARSLALSCPLVASSGIRRTRETRDHFEERRHWAMHIHHDGVGWSGTLVGLVVTRATRRSWALVASLGRPQCVAPNDLTTGVWTMLNNRVMNRPMRSRTCADEAGPTASHDVTEGDCRMVEASAAGRGGPLRS